ncbi:MAG: hypothetical protein KC431_09015, partial [Myxococcales bacterium]|nr:hypothetical protein [Myxococcales bacterium]
MAREVVAAPTKVSNKRAQKQAQAQAQKLRVLADKAETAAKRELAVDRLENTARRAAMAGSIRDRARRNLLIAQVMRRAADEVARGELEYMAKIRSRVQIEALDLALKQSRWTRERVEGQRFPDQEPMVEDIEHAEFSEPQAHVAGIEDLLASAKGLSDLDRPRALLTRLQKTADDNRLVVLGTREALAVQEMAAAVKGADREIAYSTQRILENLRDRDRLLNLGVVDTPTLQAALREYLGCCRG